jgi:hypothetical protein
LVHLQFGIGIFSVVLLLLQIIISLAHADTSSKITIKPDADVWVNGSPEAWDEHMEVSPVSSPLLQVGIPISNGQIPILPVERDISYIRFNLSDIPNSDLSNDISVNSAELRLVAISTIGSPERYFVTVSSCSDNSWSAANMTWNNRICRDHIEGQDSVIVGTNDTWPKVYSWDVTPAVSSAKHSGLSRITFVVTGFPLTYTEGERDIIQTNHTGFVRFWSKERSNSDISGSTKLIVTYTTAPTSLMNYLSITAAVVLPIIGAVWGVSHWIYGRTNSKTTGSRFSTWKRGKR